MKNSMLNGMIKTGDRDEREETIPAAVCCRATREAVTPRKGPRTAPRLMQPMALLSLRALAISGHFRRTVMSRVKAAKAASSLIWVAARAL